MSARDAQAAGAGMERPDVSIVITTCNGWALTRRCLASLLASARGSALRAEIILSDNCSSDETPRAWQAFQNGKWPVRYRRNAENLGYLRNANAGAREARGEFLCLMNNDVLVAPGWLDAQVAFLRENPEVGLVGPKYLDARGRVAECGCAVHADGSARQLGSGTALDDPEFAYANDVHYCSMACVLMPARLFADLGGYDERYAPAYYEDVDLCLRLAERGLRVTVNPQVRVTHLFGGSYAARETHELMARNRAVLCERWRERLARLHPPPGTPPARLRSWVRGDTLVFHWPFLVNPDSTTGSLRNWRLMLEARRRGLHVVLVALNEPAEQPHLQALRRQGIEVHEDVRGEERRLLRRLADAHRIAAAVLSFAIREERYGYLYDQLDPGIVRLFDTVDVHFLRELRAEERHASWGAIRGIEFGRLSDAAYAELACMLRADAVLLVSEAERRILVRDLMLPAEKFHVVSTIHAPVERVLPYAARAGFSFIGYGGHPPNVDSIQFIVREIWPEIRRALPDATLQVYGFKLPPQVLALEDAAAGVAVRGFVADHRAALGASRVMLAPLRFGAGIKGKILEALAAGTPVVTTPMGAEGIDDEGAVLCVGADARELAARAIGLYREEPQWAAASRKGLELLRRRFSAAEAGAALLEAIAAGRRLRGQGSVWTHVAYAAMAQAKLADQPQDTAARIGRRVSEQLYRLRNTRLPWLRALIRRLRGKRAPQ